MKLVQASISFPVSVIVVVLLAVLFGVIALSRIPIQMIPTLLSFVLRAREPARETSALPATGS